MAEMKTLTGVEIKDETKGEVSAVFATLDVIDKDGDVTVQGAFEDGADVRISAFGHASWGHHLPVGRGVIRATDSEAILDGKFFLDTAAGRDTFLTVKGMGDLQEWSYGFDVVDSDLGKHDDQDVRFLKSMKVHEVSPVMLGAGIDTRTLAVKGYADALNKIEAELGTSANVSASNNIFTTTNTGISTRGVFPRIETFSDQSEAVLGDVRKLIDRAKTFGSQATGTKEGRVLSAANRERLAALVTALGEAGETLGTLLADTDPDKHRTELLREFSRYQWLRTNL